MTQKLYARIKKSSKYYGQGTKGDLFEVFFVADPCGYNVIGGPGGRYHDYSEHHRRGS